MTLPAAQLWFGHTVHTRETPFRRSFRHRIAMLEIDIDRLSDAGHQCFLLSVNRANMISFRETDHGARNAAVPLRTWAEARFAEAGVNVTDSTIRLLTFPRVLGYGFAPISLWRAFSSDGSICGIIYEVHNTFGETHSYVGALAGAGGKQVAAKDFHVSPFYDVAGAYRFTFRNVSDAITLAVVNVEDEQRQHTATLAVHPRKLTSGQVLKWMIAMPISGIGVMAAIHWQALRLWLKGARYRDRPAQRARRTTTVQPAEGSDEPQTEVRKRA